MEKKVPDAVDECALWKKLKHGDREALATVFSTNYDSLFFYGKKLIRDEDVVKDCIQNLFLKIWTSRQTLMDVKVVRPYLLKSLRRHIADQVMAKNRKTIIDGNFQGDFDIVFSHEDFLIALQTSAEQSEILARSLNELPGRQREAVFLRFYEELDYIRIAEVMALNVQSVRNLIHQSVKRIKETMRASSVLVNIAPIADKSSHTTARQKKYHFA